MPLALQHFVQIGVRSSNRESLTHRPQHRATKKLNSTPELSLLCATGSSKKTGSGEAAETGNSTKTEDIADVITRAARRAGAAFPLLSAFQYSAPPRAPRAPPLRPQTSASPKPLYLLAFKYCFSPCAPMPPTFLQFLARCVLTYNVLKTLAAPPFSIHYPLRASGVRARIGCTYGLAIRRSVSIQHADVSSLCARRHFDRRLWTLPPERMKSAKQHVVPLSTAALTVLDRRQRVRTGDAVFPGRSGSPLSYASFATAPAKAGIDACTPHGWRSCFRDWCGDIGDVPRDLAEAALAHSLNATEGAYRRMTDVERRREVMTRYADWLNDERGKVLAFPTGKIV